MRRWPLPACRLLPIIFTKKKFIYLFIDKKMPHLQQRQGVREVRNSNINNIKIIIEINKVRIKFK